MSERLPNAIRSLRTYLLEDANGDTSETDYYTALADMDHIAVDVDALAARLAAVEAERDEATKRAARRWEDVQAACARAEQAYRERDRLRAERDEARNALRDIAHYEEPYPQDPSDVYEYFQAVARAVLAGETAGEPTPLGVTKDWHPDSPERQRRAARASERPKGER